MMGGYGATASNRKRQGGKRVCKSLDIRRAKGGFIVDEGFEGNMGEYYPPERSVFTDRKKVLAHITSKLGDLQI